MARLILLNGPPGIGKSTIAGLYADAIPGTLSLDIDRVRTLIGGWRSDFVGAGETVRPLALTMADVHLAGNRDVIVPQYLATAEELEAFERIANGRGARFVDLLLMDERESALDRFDAFTEVAYEAEPDADNNLRREIRTVVLSAGGREHLSRLYDELVACYAERTKAHVVTSTVRDVAGTLSSVCDAIDRHR